MLGTWPVLKLCTYVCVCTMVLACCCYSPSELLLPYRYVHTFKRSTGGRGHATVSYPNYIHIIIVITKYYITLLCGDQQCPLISV